jgi:hypothetical protein
MKNYRSLLLILCLFLFATTQAQTHKVTTKKTSKTVAVKTTTRNYGTPTAVTQITDVTEADPYYTGVKNLTENYGVTIAYEDNTFKGKEPLKRGDFIVAFNSALNNLRSKMNAAGVDTSLINTYDRNRGGAYLTTVDQIKDINESSIYYPAAKSLIERWGIGEPFSLAKTLNANQTMPEKEVYDILRVTLGYNSAGANPYTTAMSRSKFAIVLNNALSQKMTEINTLGTIVQNRRDDERRRQVDSLQRVDMARKDSVAKEIQLRKEAAAQQEIEAKKKLKQKSK